MITMIPTCMLRKHDFASRRSRQMQQTRQQQLLKSHSMNQIKKLDKNRQNFPGGESGYDCDHKLSLIITELR